MNFHERCVYGDVPYHDLFFGLPADDENSPRLLKCGLSFKSLAVVSSKARIASSYISPLQLFDTAVEGVEKSWNPSKRGIGGEIGRGRRWGLAMEAGGVRPRSDAAKTLLRSSMRVLALVLAWLALLALTGARARGREQDE
jgi:hypothetical protein